MSINKLLASIAGLIALIPGLSTLLKAEILPPVWENGNVLINVLVSVLCFTTVLILYANRHKFKALKTSTAGWLTAVLFLLLLASATSFSILSSYCIFHDLDNRAGQTAFIPIFVSKDIQAKIDAKEIGTRKEWVRMDGTEGVNRQIEAYEDGTYNIHISMFIFMLLYFMMCALLISTILILGFHLAPELEQPTGE